MSNNWFRSWHGAPTDNKWLLIAKRANVKPIHVTGTWWALLDHASQHSERGTVEDFDMETFALFAGLEEEHVSRIVTAMREKCLIVDGRIAQWGKRQPKREDETAGERKRRSRSNNGEKQAGTAGGDIPDAESVTQCHAMSRNVTTDKRRGEEKSSVANATAAAPPKHASDFCRAVFDSGVALLRRDDIEMTDRRARSIVGRWRKTLNDDARLLTILMEAETTSQSLEWVTAAVETRNGTRTRSSGVGRTEAAARAALDRRRAAQDRLGGQSLAPGERGFDSSRVIALPNAVRTIGHDAG